MRAAALLAFLMSLILVGMWLYIDVRLYREWRDHGCARLFCVSE
jgi:hypothetical protein